MLRVRNDQAEHKRCRKTCEELLQGVIIRNSPGLYAEAAWKGSGTTSGDCRTLLTASSLFDLETETVPVLEPCMCQGERNQGDAYGRGGKVTVKCQRFENTTAKTQKKKLLHEHENKISWRLGEVGKVVPWLVMFVLALGNHLLSCQARLGFLFVLYYLYCLYYVLYYLFFCSFKINLTKGNKIILLLQKETI